jgi:hypothetical protein
MSSVRTVEAERSVNFAVASEDKIVFPVVSGYLRSILTRLGSQLYILIIVPRTRRTLGAYRIPRETGLLISSGLRSRRSDRQPFAAADSTSAVTLFTRHLAHNVGVY